jgi:hypothetical protein
MKSATGNRFSIIPQGGLKEEFWEWTAIEEMCRAGKLSPQSLIFLPEEDAWKKLSESKLASCLPKSDGAATAKAAPPPETGGHREEYDRVLEQIRTSPGDAGLRVTAAEIALAMGKTERARDHFQEALEIQPYHPRVAQEARRNLPPPLWKTLKCLEKPAPVWDDPAAVFRFPYSRGPLYLAAASALLFGLFWSLWTVIPAFLVLSLWVTETARGASRGETRAPLWDRFAGDPLGRIARPLAIAALGALEVIAVFAAIAEVHLLARLSTEPNIFFVVWKSELLVVLFSTVSMLYLPAVMMLSITPAARTIETVDPRVVVRAIRLMEGEYLLSVLFAAILFSATWGIGALLGGVPLVDRAFYAAATVYVLLAGSFAFGRLQARFGDDLEKRVLGGRSSS